MSAKHGCACITISDDDLPYEEDILRNRYCLKSWLRYIEHKVSDENNNAVTSLYERALKEFPGSYKLWYAYLKHRKAMVKNQCIIDSSYEDVNNVFERSLVFMHKMPRIWLEYGEFLMLQCRITKARRVFDRALKSLPITQHDRIWSLYIDLVSSYNIPDTAVRVYRRYLKLFPERAEDYIAYLKRTYDEMSEENYRKLTVNILEECANVYVKIVNDTKFVSKEGKSKHQLWNELCELVSKHPLEIKTIKFEQIIRQGIKKYNEQVGVLWNSLANYYIRSGIIERARDIYEEALVSVMTVRDFTQVFDAYCQFEEAFIGKMMEEAKTSGLTEEDDLELELRLTRLEYLMDRRPLLLNSVLLRQNPHNVSEWLKRVKLFEGRPKNIIETYTEAVQKVDPAVATGKVEKLWIEFAKFYETNNQLDEADYIFEKATKVKFKRVDDLATVWCEWAEMQIRQKRYEKALSVLEQATTMPAYKVDYFDNNEPVQNRLYKNIKVWSMYADMEESFGTFKSCKAVYDKIIDLKICTPQLIVNFGMFLEENHYYEESFRAFEKGISLFQWPVVYDIWLIYLTKFIKRYGGKKIERTRDLFEQCLESCTSKYAKALYLLYAKLEEEHGFARRALKIYERAVDIVPAEEKFEVFNIYLKRTAELRGVTATREIYEKAIETLNDAESRQMCLRYAELERKLGEIDRARAIYIHCSQMCDPRVTSDFWQTWKEFEIKHGSEDTLREMLRIKRSVQATYNIQVNYMAAQMMSAAAAGADDSGEKATNDSMKYLEVKAAELARKALFGENKTNNETRSNDVSFVPGGLACENTATNSNNPDEIPLPDLNMDDLDESHFEIEKQDIPTEITNIVKN